MQIVRYHGVGWLAFRLLHWVKLRSGWLKWRTAQRDWSAIRWKNLCADPELQSIDSYLEWRRNKVPPFLFASKDFSKWRERLARWDVQENGVPVAEQAARIEAGTFPHYSVHWIERGKEPDWHLNPFTGERAEGGIHWTAVRDAKLGDIKNIWELSRFAWVYPLVRAYAREGDARHAETFWRLFEHWLEANPPNTGVNWMCGQEISIRMVAWMFGLYGFIDTDTCTPERMQRMAVAVAESAQRIEANLPYALSQNNNHGISECAGLMLAGLLFPELRGATRWRHAGWSALQTQVAQLFYADGSFAQHSSNYHRLALQMLVVIYRLQMGPGAPALHGLKGIIGRAAEHLRQLVQPQTGYAPNTGGNDGALLFPLSPCDYRDFRPALQAASIAGNGHRVAAPGAWDEEALWLGIGGDLAQLPAMQLKPGNYHASDGGVHVLRSGDWCAVAHARTYRHRPAHADQLHVDIFWRGLPVAVDAGTYSYRGAPPFQTGFKSTRLHNTVEVDGISQMETVGRFMLLPWCKAWKVDGGKSADGTRCWVLLEHDAYQRLADPVRHLRRIEVSPDGVTVTDSLHAAQPHQSRLHWLLDIDDHSRRIKVDVWNGTSELPVVCRRADPESAEGWQSVYYQELRPADAVSYEATGSDLTLTTQFTSID